MEPREAQILCDGQWRSGETDRWHDVYEPSTGKVIAKTPLCGAEQTARVVEAAAAALPGWSATPAVERARFMFRYRELIDRHLDELASLITREHGKTQGEAQAEMKRGLEMVEFACGIPSLIMGRNLPDIATGVDAETARYPVGVCVGITPFNFPAMVPMWMFPVALACGNTFVLKPSEKVPLCAVRLGELIQEAGFPDGVFNLVHGDRSCVDALLTHPLVGAVSFVGSTPIAKYIYETGTSHGKRVQAAGGAKNHMIVMPDADLSLATEAISASAYGCAGQRCMAGSVAVTVGSAGDAIVDRLRDSGERLRVGPGDDEEVDMGPLIRPEAVERVHSYLDGAVREGATVALDGRRDFEGAGFWVGPSVVDRVTPAMRIAREEVFGPVLSVIRADDLEAAIAVGRDCPYGNGASIFTRDGHAAREFKQRFNAGMIGVNVGVPAPMAWFPFTGWNQSFFGDLHLQGMEGVCFYTRQKTTLTRWSAKAEGAGADPLWSSR